jgi:hypothetical protein
MLHATQSMQSKQWQKKEQKNIHQEQKLRVHKQSNCTKNEVILRNRTEEKERTWNSTKTS